MVRPDRSKQSFEVAFTKDKYSNSSDLSGLQRFGDIIDSQTLHRSFINLISNSLQFFKRKLSLARELAKRSRVCYMHPVSDWRSKYPLSSCNPPQSYLTALSGGWELL